MLPFGHCYFESSNHKLFISNVQNVRLQRRHGPTDDACTRRWRGSQQTGPVRIRRRADTRAAGRRPCLCCGTHAAALQTRLNSRLE